MIRLKSSIITLLLLRIIIWIYWVLGGGTLLRIILLQVFSKVLFPSRISVRYFLVPVFVVVGGLNLISIIVYSYPVRTTLRFNLIAAFSCWILRVLFQVIKYSRSSSVLPINTPWYLVPFLCVVEVVRIVVRPITLCFRLLANITAGHVLLALIYKLPYAWLLRGRVFFYFRINRKNCASFRLFYTY